MWKTASDLTVAPSSGQITGAIFFFIFLLCSEHITDRSQKKSAPKAEKLPSTSFLFEIMIQLQTVQISCFYFNNFSRYDHANLAFLYIGKCLETGNAGYYVATVSPAVYEESRPVIHTGFSPDSDKFRPYMHTKGR